MIDDPREILKAAGVECAELDTYAAEREHPAEGAGFWGDLLFIDAETSDTTTLALAQLVAKYKWAAESLQTELLQAALDHGFSIPTLAARLAEYEAGHAA